MRGFLPALLVVLVAALAFVPSVWAATEVETAELEESLTAEESLPVEEVAPEEVAPSEDETLGGVADTGSTDPSGSAPVESAPVASAEPEIAPPSGIPAPPASDTAPAAPAQPPPPSSVPVEPPAVSTPPTAPTAPTAPVVEPVPAPPAAPVPEPVPAPSSVGDKWFEDPIPAPSSEPAAVEGAPLDPFVADHRRGVVELLHLRTVLRSQFRARHAAEPSETAGRGVMLASTQRRGTSAAGSGGSASPSFSPDGSGGSFALVALLLLGLAQGGLIVRIATTSPGSLALRFRLERPG